VRALAVAAAIAALTLSGVGAAAAPPTSGVASVGGDKLQLRYAAAFKRRAAPGYGGYAILLTEKLVRCGELAKLPYDNSLEQPWVLVALFPTKDGFLPTGLVGGEVEYPVGDAYVSLSRGVTIKLTSAAPVPGVRWRGTVSQPPRTINGSTYSVRAGFNARWCR
jgi:hypothetical protein